MKNSITYSPALTLGKFAATTLLTSGLLLAMPYQSAIAQSTETESGSTDNSGIVFSEGVSGQMDTKDRSPVVSVGSVVKDGTVTMLVNAYVRDSDTEIYPTKFEIFIGNKLVASLLKPAEQVEPLIVPIDPSIGQAPLAYTVHAQIIHPSRTFSTVSSGTIFNSTLTTANLSCDVVTVSTNSETEELSETTYTAEGDKVQLTQTSDNVFTISIDAEDGEEDQIKVSGTVTIASSDDSDSTEIEDTADNTATSTLTVLDGGESSSVETSGSVELDENQSISSFELVSEDEGLIVRCE